jgi:pimeloyl-ACP methyl ester carboxylesterase
MFWHDEIDPSHEPHKVLIHKGAWVDEARDGRVVPYKIYYPVNHDMRDLPLIIWSHGLGGGRDGAAFLARFIASYGYVVIHPQHFGTDTTIWEGKPGHPWDVIRKTEITRDVTLDRFYDIPFVLEQLPAFKAENADIGAHMDLENIGICGHSFGALTTQIMAGQTFPDHSDTLIQIKPDVFKAGILYSFVPMGHITDAPPEEIFGAMDLPLFFMTGTKDDSPISGKDYTYRMPAYDHAGHDKNILMVLKDGDHMVFTGSRGKLGAYPKRKEHEAIIKATSLAYWDAHLKGDKDAAQWLTKGGMATYVNGEARIQIGKK